MAQKEMRVPAVPDSPPTGLPPDTSSPRMARVTRRAFLLGLALALMMCAVMPYNDYYVGATYLSGNFFPIGAVGAVLLLVLAVNPLLIRLGRRHVIFSPGEIMTVWAMILVVAGIPSSGLMRYLIPHIVAPTYYANAANGWTVLIISHLPSRLLVTDPYAVRTFFEGVRRGEPIPWGAWAGPLSWWSLFVFCLFSVFFCLSALVRRQWVDNERFAFPLVVLPVLLAEAPEPGQRFNSLLRAPLLWAGVGLVTLLHTVNGMHLFYPTLPEITTVIHSSDYLTARPWNGLNDMELAIFPLVIGFSYLLSTEVCFSLWFFYLVFKVQILMGSLNAWDMAGASGSVCMGPAWTAYEEAGGSLMLAIWLLWGMRSHLREIWRRAVYNAPDVDDAREPLSYRAGFFGLIAAYGGMYLWLTLAARMNALLALGMVVGSFVIFLVLSWLVAQAGLLFIQQAFSPAQIVTVIGGTAPFDASSLTMASLTEHVGWQDTREFMLPSLLNSFKAASETEISARSLTRALAVCVLLAVLVSGASSIWLPYTHGGGIALKNPWMYVQAPQASLSWAAAQVHNPRPPQGAGLLNMAGGALLVLVLFLCRANFSWFSLHPAGFLVAATYPMYTLWFSLLLGWLAKGPIMRYGGIRGYRLLLPLFLGFILGDCINALIWTVVGIMTGTGYKLLPG